jgi:hypothetical protein
MVLPVVTSRATSKLESWFGVDEAGIFIAIAAAVWLLILFLMVAADYTTRGSP